MRRRYPAEKILIAISLTVAVCTTLLVFWYRATDPRQQHKGFSRMIWQARAVAVHTLPLTGSGHYIASRGGQPFYLAHPKRIDRLWEADWENEMLSERALALPALDYRNIRTEVVGSRYHCYDGSAPLWISGTVGSSDFVQHDSMPYFLLASATADSNALVVSRYKGLTTLGRVRQGQRPVFSPFLLETQVDGFFCRLGHLHVDDRTGKAVYLHTYRNSFVVADTGWTMLYQGKTIDTISRAKIRTATRDSVLTLVAPSLAVNKKSVLQWPYLYVYSNIMARNERSADFRRNAVIDVYYLGDGGTYEYSFYIPPYKRWRLLDFRMVGPEEAIVLYPDAVVYYRFSARG